MTYKYIELYDCIVSRKGDVLTIEFDDGEWMFEIPIDISELKEYIEES